MVHQKPLLSQGVSEMELAGLERRPPGCDADASALLRRRLDTPPSDEEVLAMQAAIEAHGCELLG